MRKISFLLFLSLLILSARAADLRARVLGSDGSPIEAASLKLSGSKVLYGTTDKQGRFLFRELPQGRYTLEVSMMGYEDKVLSITIRQAQDEVDLGEILLQEASTRLQEAVVVARRHTSYNSHKVSSTSLRLGEDLLLVPQNIQVIGKSLLQDRQIADLSEGVLANISGTSKIEHWGGYTRINARGGRMSAFRDGMNVTTSWGPMTEDMAFVEALEIVKGPAGFLMSNGEPNGIYNVVTKKPVDKKIRSMSLSYGSFDFFRTTLDLGDAWDKEHKLLYRLAAYGQSSQSHRAYEFSRKYGLAPMLSYRIGAHTEVMLQYMYQYLKRSNIGAPYLFSPEGYATLPRETSFLEPGLTPTVTNDHNLMARLSHELSPRWQLTAQMAYLLSKRTGESMWSSGKIETNGDMIRRISTSDAELEMQFGQFFLNGKERWLGLEHKLLLGLDLGHKLSLHDWMQRHDLDTALDPFNVFTSKRGNPSNGYPEFDHTTPLVRRANTTRIEQSYMGLYVQDELGFFQDRLRLTLAGRYTHVKDSSYGTTETEEKHFSPRLGLSGSIDAMTSVYALYDQSFNPVMGLLRSGSKAKPVTGNNLEVGVKRRWMGGRFTTSLSLYQITRLNETSADPSNAAGESFVVQDGASRARGVEVDFSGELLPGLELVAGYAYTDYRVTKSVQPSRPVGMRMPGHAKHTINLWLKYRLPMGFHIALGQNTLLNRSSWKLPSPQSGVKDLPDYHRWDGSMGWSNQKFTILLGINNLTNSYLYSGAAYDNASPAVYWQAEPGRNFRLTVSYNF